MIEEAVEKQFQIHPEFDAFVHKALGHYVYILIDPRINKPFYVGKAGGKDGVGNQRVLHHLYEAKKALAGAHSRSEKIKTIREIWSEGRQVDWKIVRYNLPDEQTTLHVEAAVIDALEMSGINLTNAQSGHGKQINGTLDPMTTYALGATPFDPVDVPEELIDIPIFIFNIAHGIANCRANNKNANERDLIYCATRASWRRSKLMDAEKSVAMGIVGSICFGAFSVERWIQDGDRWKFEGRPLEGSAKSAFHNKNMNAVVELCKGYVQRGNYIAFTVRKNSQVEIIRGKQS